MDDIRIKIGLGFLGAIVLITGGYFLIQNKDNLKPKVGRNSDVIARVNGEEIDSAEIVSAQESIGQ